MTITTKALSDLLQYFAMPNSSNRIISLALTANESLAMDVKQQGVTFAPPSWDSTELENSTMPPFINQLMANSSTVPYATNDTDANGLKVALRPRISTEIPIWVIPCYSVIFIFAIVGNLLVASTLFQNRRMRTITNVFLANLAISDMLLGVLCMPITLVGTYLRHFIFGELVCKFIQFAQAASVAVSSWTLVAISCERYYAICHPLRSRTWQTVHHAYKIIGGIWIGSVICMAPIAIFSQLIPTSRQGLRKCREQWPDEAIGYERFYNIFLDLVLLVFPLAILCVAYILITRTLYMGIKDEKALIFGSKNNNMCGSRYGAANNGKLYTRVETEVKTPNVFHLNMSFRYHTRKCVTTAVTGSNAIGECVNRGDTLRVIKTATNDNSKDMKCFKRSDVEGKYATPSTVPRTLCKKRPLSYSLSASSREDMEISFNKTQSPLRPHGNDDITLIAACDADEADPVASLATHRRSKSFSKTFSTPAPHFSRPHQRSRFNSKQHSQRNDDTEALSPHIQEHRRHQKSEFDGKRKLSARFGLCVTESTLRRSNIEKTLESKKRVVKMLFVLVLEFFLCWTPLYVINTVAMFIGPPIYEYIDYTTISFLQLLAYSSSCCNPITYCFMNASFRRAFVDTFKDMHLNGFTSCHKSSKTEAGNSIGLTNTCTVVIANTVLASTRS